MLFMVEKGRTFIKKGTLIMNNSVGSHVASRSPGENVST